MYVWHDVQGIWKIRNTFFQLLKVTTKLNCGDNVRVVSHHTKIFFGCIFVSSYRVVEKRK